MKLLTILILLVIASTNYDSAQTRQVAVAATNQVNPEDEIKKLEEARNQAVLHGDVAALGRMTSDDYTFITLRGEMRTKTDILKGFASGSFHYESREISDLTVRIYQNTAIVTGQLNRERTSSTFLAFNFRTLPIAAGRPLGWSKGYLS